jgi:hypothetical protein
MTPLQNDPKQHQHEAKHRKGRIPCGGKRSPGSESARRELSKSGLASRFGPQKCDFPSNSAGGTTGGGTTVHSGPAKPDSVCYTRDIEKPPIAYAVGGMNNILCATIWAPEPS